VTNWQRRLVTVMTKDLAQYQGGKGIVNAATQTILDEIGNTTLLALRNIVPENGSRILLKLESENPTGSIKDRMAVAMVEADGRLLTMPANLAQSSWLLPRGAP